MELCSISKKSLEEWLSQNGKKSFHSSQVFDWVYKKNATCFSEMTNLSLPLRESLEKSFSFPLLQSSKITFSDDKETIKFLWKLKDDRFVESVLIMSGDRRTLCVSSQVGCPGRCAFCASGKKGLIRNLSVAEIVEQLVHVNRYLQKNDERISHIVFMGMGEPLDNYENVMNTIRKLIDPNLFGISQRRITVSTVGVVEKIHEMTEEDFSVHLVLSLHAPNQHIRKKIIPYARKYGYEEVLHAMKNYSEKTKRDVTYEYTLIAGINDSIGCARELAKVLKNHRCTVNLIPYNHVEGLSLKRPSGEKIQDFREVLDSLNVRTTWRYTKGKDIAAACGQLALQEQEKASSMALS